MPRSLDAPLRPNPAYAAPIGSAELSRRIQRVVGYAPFSEMGDLQPREFHEALLDANAFEDLPGRREIVG
jgi:hypothetical protein